MSIPLPAPGHELESPRHATQKETKRPGTSRSRSWSRRRRRPEWRESAAAIEHALQRAGCQHPGGAAPNKKRGRPSNESKGVPSVSCVGGDTLGSCHITTACETCRLCLAHIPENPTCAECIQCLGDCGSSRGNTRASAIYKYDASGTSPARLRPDVEPDLGAYDEGGGPIPSPMVHRSSDDHVRHFPLNHAASGLSDIGVAFGRRFDNIPSARQLDKAMRGETV